MRKIPFIEAVALLVGAVVGAGFLGIPYVVQKIGFSLGAALIIGIGILMLFQLLIVAEIALRTRDKHQIAGYVEKYLGKHWHGVIFTLVILESYGAMLALTIGEGRVLSALFGGSFLIYGVVFLIIAAVLVFFDLRAVEGAELALTSVMVLAVLVVGLFALPHVEVKNLAGISFEGTLPAYGVILFAFLGVAAVPEMKQVMIRREKSLAKTIMWGMAIPATIYLFFTATVLGALGPEVTHVATVGLGEKLGKGILVVGNLLAAITMTSAFLALALALKETFWYDLKFSRNNAWLLTMLIPLILFLFGIHGFISTIVIVGAIFGGLQGIILVFTWWKAVKNGDREPEFSFPFPRSLGWLLICILALGVAYTLAGW